MIDYAECCNLGGREKHCSVKGSLVLLDLRREAMVKNTASFKGKKSTGWEDIKIKSWPHTGLGGKAAVLNIADWPFLHTHGKSATSDNYCSFTGV